MSNACVLLVEDDPSMREALEDLARSVGLAVRSFPSVREFLNAPRPDGPCCLVLDVRLPGHSGLDLQAELARAPLPPPVIFITGHGDVAMSVRAMKAGAIEFLTKPFRDQDLLDAIQLGLDRDRAQREAFLDLSDLQRRFETLTPRERQVMALVTAGLMNKQIAADIEVSEITVKVHRGQVMRKMQAGSVAELVRMVDKLELSVTEAR